MSKKKKAIATSKIWSATRDVVAVHKGMVEGYAYDDAAVSQLINVCLSFLQSVIKPVNSDEATSVKNKKYRVTLPYQAVYPNVAGSTLTEYSDELGTSFTYVCSNETELRDILGEANFEHLLADNTFENVEQLKEFVEDANLNVVEFEVEEVVENVTDKPVFENTSEAVENEEK